MSGAPPFRDEVSSRIERLHDRATDFFTALDQGGTFREDRWERNGGGGGVSRMLTDGATFERAGINRSPPNCWPSASVPVYPVWSQPGFSSPGLV